ncbi:uncharacterized protein LOC120010124 [Tripterygium wilfordii]|uniref:uncharacterized protein LOC120010124 n=1 Tax=Tripterygium wilfordii TaxID=458696 RepID=UPI0018F7ED81|nr:uncharacterized protein LOC120010124 [Tripterygium wilfordii]
MDKLWGGNSATGDEVISQSVGDNNCCHTPQSVTHVDMDILGDDLSIGFSPNNVITPLQEASSTGHAAGSTRQTSFSTSKGCRRKNNSTTDITPPEVQNLCIGLKITSAEQWSYYVSKKTTSDEKRAYFASKKVYYENMTVELDIMINVCKLWLR